jgi:hypothetical protein
MLLRCRTTPASAVHLQLGLVAIPIQCVPATVPEYFSMRAINKVFHEVWGDLRSGECDDTLPI